MNFVSAQIKRQSASFALCALFLLLATSWLLAALPQQAVPENYVWEIFSIDYDAPIAEAIDLGNRTETSTSNYDISPIHRADGEHRSALGTCALFGPNAEFKAAEGAQPLALGLKNAGLDAFAEARGATTATGEDWQAIVSEKLNDPNTMVHFNLDGVDVWPGVQRAATGVEGNFGPTDWELLQIKQNPQSWDTLQFWKGGQPAPNPFK